MTGDTDVVPGCAGHVATADVGPGRLDGFSSGQPGPEARIRARRLPLIREPHAFEHTSKHSNSGARPRWANLQGYSCGVSGFSKDEITDLCALIYANEENCDIDPWPPSLSLYKSVVIQRTPRSRPPEPRPPRPRTTANTPVAGKSRTLSGVSQPSDTQGSAATVTGFAKTYTWGRS
jgi:hypothetical protein